MNRLIHSHLGDKRPMPVQDDQQAIDALTFPKVTVGHDKSGYLTPLSAKLLLIELERAGKVCFDHCKLIAAEWLIGKK